MAYEWKITAGWGSAPSLTETEMAGIDKLLLDGAGRMRLLPAAEVLSVGHERLRSWCAQRARYIVVTAELVDWLRRRIDGREALEVCAGMGDLGYHLGIRMTDSHVQARNESFRQVVSDIAHAATTPPADVERVDAEQAVRLYKPRVVVGAYVTQHGTQFGPDRDRSCSWGPREERFLEVADEYIHIGTLTIHGEKRILAAPHQIHRPPGLITRGAYPENNAVWTWCSNELREEDLRRFKIRRATVRPAAGSTAP